MLQTFRFVALLRSWFHSSRNQTLAILSVAVTGLVGGLGGAALIGIINSVLGGRISNWGVAGFLCLCFLIPLDSCISSILLARFSERAAYDARLRLCQQMLATPYATLEDIGNPRLLAAVTEDIHSILTAISSFPSLITQLVVVCACVIYLTYLSRPLAAILLIYMILGVYLHRIPVRRAVSHWQRHREAYDTAYKHLQSLIEGIKELKLNSVRRSTFVAQQLQPALATLCRHSVAASGFGSLAAAGGQMLFYIFISLVLFLGPNLFVTNHRILTGYVLVVLYLMSPIAFVLNWLPTAGRALVASDKLTSLGLCFSDKWPDAPMGSTQKQQWRELELIGVKHAYRHEMGSDTFCLGPMTLAFRPGELVFVTGGNGSGKTTLAKLLVGLYEPQQGAIYFDRDLVTPEARDTYRQYFSAIFTDAFLFEQALGLEDGCDDKRISKYLRELDLDHKVTFERGGFSTISLSRGQRKRLLLLITYLENRPICVFDEWASDQEPAFRDVFYYKVLPELKARQKAVVVITHDDRYYHVADRIIKLERGQLQYDVCPSAVV